jgi:hypothetical protein
MNQSSLSTQPVEQVSEARHALMHAAEGDPERWWTADELHEAIQNGYPSTIVSIALNDLVESRALRLNDRLRIQYAR